MTAFTPFSGLIGGVLIGVASVLLLLANGRIAGISGIFGGLLPPTRGDLAWRLLFVVGLIAAGLIWPLLSSKSLPVELPVGLLGMVVAGFLVGFGTRLGGGCTSGHGVCGIARRAPRSIAATLLFMAAGILTTFIFRHVLGS